MRNRLGRRGLRLLVAATALIAIAAGVSYAAIPNSSSGTINGCYEKRTGLLRVIDAQAGKTCTQFETPISWNQQGPKGEAGAQGPAGPTGLAGAVGATGPQGLKGDAGAQGVKGDQGDPGATGVQGPKGEAGAEGPAGSAGPQGPQGPKGDAGAPGPAALAALEGTACVRTDGSAGTVHVPQGDTIAITCAAFSGGGGGGQCPEPLPSYPHATVRCAGGVITLGSCDPGWSDANGQLEDGCETVMLGGEEICGNGIDDNGDGQIDERCGPPDPFEPNDTQGSAKLLTRGRHEAAINPAGDEDWYRVQYVCQNLGGDGSVPPLFEWSCRLFVTLVGPAGIRIRHNGADTTAIDGVITLFSPTPPQLPPLAFRVVGTSAGTTGAYALNVS